MIQQNLQFATAINAETAQQVRSTLEAITGVSRVVIGDADNRVSVFYDEERTSSQELVARLARAGYAARAPHAGGGCCGSCGG